MYKNYLEHVKKFGEKDTTIDRKDNNGDYCKENCIWATRKIQENNRRNNHFLTYNGEIMTISQWANKLKLGNNILFSRIKLGWSIEKALTTPVKLKNK